MLLLATLVASQGSAQTPADLFDANVVQDIRFTINPNDWARLRQDFRDNTYYPADWEWRGIYVDNVGIRSRGLGSRSGAKPGLRVDFNRYELGQTFLSLKSVILRNNTQDPSHMHERLSMLLFQRMGHPASREVHARMFVNGEYFGLYTIVESIDKDFLTRIFRENDGFLYEYQWVNEYKWEYRGSDPARYSPSPFKPETHENDPDARPIEGMIRTINQTADGDWIRAVSAYLDPRLFLSYLATENYLGENDGITGYAGTNNFFIYRFERRNLHQMIAWDKSETLKQPATHPIFWNLESNVMARRALGFPELRTHYLQELVRAASMAGGPGGFLDQEVLRLYQQIREPALADTNKQCPGSDGLPRPCTNAEFEADVVNIRRFVRERAAYVLSEVAAAGLAPAAGAPRLADGGLVNAASFQGAALAPGSLVSLFGERLSSGTAAATTLPLPAELGAVSVHINGRAAPLLFVSPAQINLQIPWEVATGSASVTALANGLLGNAITASIGDASPGVFVAVRPDGSPITAARPVTGGEVLIVYANGLGPVDQLQVTGQAAPSSPLASTREPPRVTVGGTPAEILFAGLTPGFVGLYQINIRLASGIPAGAATPLVVSIGGQTAPAVSIATR